MNIKITGTGSSIPERIQPNVQFSSNSFFDATGSRIENPNEEIIEKFQAITGIEQRRYIREDQTVLDIALEAAQNAITDASLDAETLDYIIFAHNVGDIALNSNQVNTLPSLASKLKAALKIKNPECVAYDILFGCPRKYTLSPLNFVAYNSINNLKNLVLFLLIKNTVP